MKAPHGCGVKAKREFSKRKFSYESGNPRMDFLFESYAVTFLIAGYPLWKPAFLL